MHPHPEATRGGSPGAAQAERRATVRYETDLLGACRPLTARLDKPAEATVRDLSAGGIGLLATRRFEPAALVAVEVFPHGDASPALLVARVVHATPWDDGRWLLGCQFVRPLGDDELRDLLG
ncbi:MAG TPA: PilZ domain-containing protein [Gemmataceae bacterium]|nr:PilZ domain-containing protein [Gemmataceae bacterium]